ncbi:UNVERIFIED_CONTAM: O-antigen ligase family protein [Bacteroidetes bacterium 56_B9]
MNGRENIGFFKTTKLTYFLFGGYWLFSFFEGYISGSFGSISKYYIFVLILYLLYKSKKLVITKQHGIIALWAVYYFATLLWTPHFDLAMTYFNSVMGMTVLLLLILGTRFEKKFVEWTLKCVTICSFLLGLLGIFFSKDYLGRISSRRVLTLFGTQLDPNNLVALYAYGLCLGLYYLVFTDISFKRKMFYILGVSITAFDILMTGSRSGIIVIAAALFIVITKKKEGESQLITFAKRAAFIIGLIILMRVLLSLLPADILLRITGGDKNLSFMDSTGRTERWQQGLRYWWNTNPIFGCGWGAFECHGTFFTLLVDTGLIGITLFVGNLIYITYQCIKRKKYQGLMIEISGLIPAFLIGAQNRRFFWNAIILPVMILNAIGDEDE